MKPVLAIFLLVLCAFQSPQTSLIDNPEGAFVYQSPQGEEWILLKDGYLSHTVFNRERKQFISTRGGAIAWENNQLHLKVEFDTRDRSAVGKKEMGLLTYSDKALHAGNKHFTAADDGASELAGYYRISQRRQGGALNTIPFAARRTIKLLTATKFQWFAINAETGEFFGTGGGRYTFTNGKYTEHIDFFSRDSSRLGASLQFSDTLQGKNWIHSGLSSKGDPIYEIWSREKPLF